MTAAIHILNRCIILGCISLGMNLGVLVYLVRSWIKEKEAAKNDRPGKHCRRP